MTCVLFGVTHRCWKKKTNFKPFVLRLSCTFIFNFNYRFHSILWVLSNATFGFHITSSRDNKNEIVSHLSGNQTIESKLLENVQQLFEFETSSSSLAHQSTYYPLCWIQWTTLFRNITLCLRIKNLIWACVACVVSFVVFLEF